MSVDSSPIFKMATMNERFAEMPTSSFYASFVFVTIQHDLHYVIIVDIYLEWLQESWYNCSSRWTHSFNVTCMFKLNENPIWPQPFWIYGYSSRTVSGLIAWQGVGVLVFAFGLPWIRYRVEIGDMRFSKWSLYMLLSHLGV